MSGKRRAWMKYIWECSVKDTWGLTLAELIVTFALTSILMVSAAFVFTGSLRMHYRMKSASTAMIVSDLLLDRISGEIASAAVSENDGYCFQLEQEADVSSGRGEGSTWVAFSSRNGSSAMIYSGKPNTENETEGELVIKYFNLAADHGNEFGAGSLNRTIPEITWKFDSNVYMGCKIKKLTFSRPDPIGHPNVIRIDLTLENMLSGFEYSTYCYAENYNYKEQDFMVEICCPTW